MIRILVDSSADFTAEDLKKYGVTLVPISVSLGGQDYLDGINLTKDEFYKILTAGSDFPKTAQPSPNDFLEIFEDAKQSHDDVIYLALSSALSGTYQSATIAKEMAEYDRIYLIDTKSATAAIFLAAKYATQLAESGKAADEIAEILTTLCPRIKIAAGIDTLEFLHRGGRLSRASAAVGQLANIKPLITVSAAGTVELRGKALGSARGLQTLFSRFKCEEIDPEFPIYSVYTLGTENCEKLERLLTDDGYTVAERRQVGPSIGAHIGPGAYGIIYVTAK